MKTLVLIRQFAGKGLLCLILNITTVLAGNTGVEVNTSNENPMANETVVVMAALGEESAPAEDVTAVQYTVDFAPLYPDINSLKLDLWESWLGDLSETTTDFRVEGNRLIVTIIRNDRVPQTGYSEVGVFSIVIVEELDGNE